MRAKIKATPEEEGSLLQSTASDGNRVQTVGKRVIVNPRSLFFVLLILAAFLLVLGPSASIDHRKKVVLELLHSPTDIDNATLAESLSLLDSATMASLDGTRTSSPTCGAITLPLAGTPSALSPTIYPTASPTNNPTLNPSASPTGAPTVGHTTPPSISIESAIATSSSAVTTSVSRRQSLVLPIRFDATMDPSESCFKSLFVNSPDSCLCNYQPTQASTRRPTMPPAQPTPSPTSPPTIRNTTHSPTTHGPTPAPTEVPVTEEERQRIQFQEEGDLIIQGPPPVLIQTFVRSQGTYPCGDVIEAMFLETGNQTDGYATTHGNNSIPVQRAIPAKVSAQPNGTYSITGSLVSAGPHVLMVSREVIAL